MAKSAPTEAVDVHTASPDEISLRELYLVLRRSIGFIVAVPMLAAAAVYLVLGQRPDVYVSESVAVVTPPAIAIEGARGLTFQPSAVRFETFQALAMSNPVLLAVGQHPDVIDAAGEPLALRSVRAAVELAALAPANGDAITVSHRATWVDPDVATAIANVWAAESLEAVRFTLLDSLSPVDEATRSEIIELGERLQAAEAAVEAFDGANLLELARSQLETLAQRVTRDEFAITDLARQIAVTESRVEALEAQLRDELRKVTSSDPASDTFLAGLSFDEAQAFLAEQREVSAVAWHRARAALDAFNNTHNLNLYDAEIDEYTNLLASATIDLERLTDRLELLQDTRTILDQQLTLVKSFVGATNARSDAFLSDLSLDEVLAFLEADAARLESRHEAARAALDAFDAEHDLGRIDLAIDDITRGIVRREAVLAALPGQMQVVRERIFALERQLALQPEQLLFREALIGNPLLLESLRSGEEDLVALGTERSELNPTFVSLINQVNDAYVEQAALNAQQEVVANELVELDAQLETLRSQRITLATERSQLSFTASLTQDLFRAAATRASDAESAALDPRGADRVLRSASDTLLADIEADLEAQRLSVERDIARVRADINVLTNRIERAEERLPDLRATRIQLTTQRRELEADANRTENALRTIDNRLDTIRLAQLDPRGERFLRDTTPEVLQLQTLLREESVALQSARAELAARTQQLSQERSQLADARQSVARLETERAQLARTVSNARSAYEDVAPLGPIIAYMTQLAPTTARVLAGATPPTDPEPRRQLLIALLAYVVLAFALVVLVLLREAVRDPNQQGPKPSERRVATTTNPAAASAYNSAEG